MATTPKKQTPQTDLQSRIGYCFHQPKLLRRALTHSSLAYEQSSETDGKALSAFQDDELSDNEQLEFLGDAVIGLIVADSLYRRYPELREGELTRLRAALVSRQHLGKVGVELELGAALFLGKGEERSGGRRKNALLANALEALIGALYLDAGVENGLDGGLGAVRVFVERWVVEPYVNELRSTLERGGSIGDHKSALQEFFQARKVGQPQYVVKSESGPDHRKRFLVEVRIPALDTEARSRILARGSGTTKKHAEQEAARRAYQKLLREGDSSQTIPAAKSMVEKPACLEKPASLEKPRAEELAS